MDEKIINNIKSLAIDMIQEAGSGHPGIALGAAPILYTLYANHLNVSTSDPNWMNRDRFVMSAGHGSALLYATLYMAGFSLTIQDLKRFRHHPSKTPGHPEVGVTPGVDVSTGPLGQGIATAVGLALGEKMLKVRTLKENKSLVDHKVYVLCGDGDLMEGISYEATSLAGSLSLDNLIVLYDSNQITLDGTTFLSSKENTKERFKSIGWDYLFVKDGTNVASINKAITKAKTCKKPVIIEIKTTIGKGSYLEGTNQVHGKLLTIDDVKQLKYNLGVPSTPFFVDETLRNEFRRKVAERSNVAYTRWANIYREFAQDQDWMKKIAFSFNGNIQCNFLNYDFKLENIKEATRVTNKKIMNEIASYIPFLIGGAADVASSTNAYLENQGDIIAGNFAGKNIRFGIREHAMGAIANGLALSNFRTFASTFLCFADYLKPAIRMSSLMHLPVIYIFTHDTILVGQDGSTHQPIEQLAMLRSIPNTYVYRPSDAKEVIGAWNTILNKNDAPSILILSRTEVPQIPTTNASLVEKGAYIIHKEVEKLDLVIIASGTEVQTAFSLMEQLKREYQLETRIVSMPSMNLFEEQPKEYQEQVLSNCKHIFMLEASSTLGLERYASDTNHVLGLDRFGVSGVKEEVLKEMQFDFDSLKQRILEQLKNQS